MHKPAQQLINYKKAISELIDDYVEYRKTEIARKN